MDIMRPRVWRICGWAATALLGGIGTLTSKIVYDGRGMSARIAPVLIVMTVACALLAGVRLFAPPIAKLRQEIELNFRLQRRVLGVVEPPDVPAPALRLMPPLGDDAADSTAPHRYKRAAGQ